jgi:hypothetical protein
MEQVANGAVFCFSRTARCLAENTAHFIVSAVNTLDPTTCKFKGPIFGDVMPCSPLKVNRCKVKVPACN